MCVGIGLILGAQWFGFIPDSRIEQEAARRKTCQNIAISTLDDIRNQRWPILDSMLKTIVKKDDQLLSIGVRTELGELRIATDDHTRCWTSPETVQKLTSPDGSRPIVVDDIPEWARPSLAKQKKAAPPRPASGLNFAEDGRAKLRSLTEKFTGSDDAPDDSPSADATPSQNDTLCLEIPIMLKHQHWGNLEFCFRKPPAGLFGGVLDAGITKFIVFFIACGMGSYTLLMMRIMGVFSRTQVVPDRVRQALDTLAEGLLVLDASEKIVLANENFLTINGFEMDELIDRLASDLPWFFPSQSTESAKTGRVFPWSRAIQERQSVTAEILRMTGRDGVHRVFSVNAGPIGEDDKQKGALVTFQDVTHVEKHRVELENMLTMLRKSKDEITKKNQELEILATRDALTGCLNRRAFFERMEPMLEQFRREARPLSCFMVDVDHFKSVNDTYGHHTGDEVLRAVSAVLRQMFEEQHIVCRYGGEEFCVMLPGFDLDQAFEQAERTRLAIMNVRLSDPESLRLTASIGVSETRFGAEETQDLINQADECLYVAKRGGRNQSVVYDPERISVLGEEEPQTSDIADPDLAQLPFHAVTALVSALAYRDPATAEHSRRVADLCVKASDGLLCQRETYVLEIAALLHDIGKIGVPDTVLHKPGPLDDNEWKIMRRHNTVGLDIVAGTFHCEELQSVIRYHHSMTRDPGNNRTIDFKNTPISSRLLKIADTYDSMTSDRSYRKGCTSDEAIAELRRCAGTQFDTELVEHFLKRTVFDSDDQGLGFPTSRGIALAMPKHTALKIGQQIEQLADAIDSQDIDSLKELAFELGEIAESNFLMPIAESTARIGEVVNNSEEDVQWVDLFKETQILMDLCRATQNAHLTEASSAY
ncbi:diguanylate cyclase and metal dependent phosphohydrolase [Rhodopirellula sallentina SM41]|uniref:diguanylate cyclase n=1 Tax=Rhodopirellula sallentina SM41 TaxID=1263870 RepID=M5TWE2_9BACT|nr:diguanylate cyclase and metal dependent phosphohydrolase [Rhodopirellula sallentina SM41]